MLKDTIQADMFAAMKQGDKQLTQTLRFLLAAINRFETDNYPPGSKNKLSDADVTNVIQKQVKEHKESIAAYSEGKRQDLVDQETQELAIISKYAPKQMSEEEIRQKIKQLLIPKPADFGQAMRQVMAQLRGQADGSLVSKIVKEELLSKKS